MRRDTMVMYKRDVLDAAQVGRTPEELSDRSVLETFAESWVNQRFV